MNKLLEVALSQYGVKEIPGQENNLKILKYFREIGHSWVTTDETAWCSAFVNWCAHMAGYERSGKLNARSWIEVGDQIGVMGRVSSPGDIVVFWRESPDSWKGHVGLYISENEDNIHVLGGNQNNSVCIKEYPKNRLLTCNRLSFVGWK